MHSSTGLCFSNTAGSPPTIMVIAGGRPLTGESSISTPRRLHSSASRRIRDGALVVVSIHAPPRGSPARIPVSGSSATRSASAGPGSDVNTTPAASATARGLSAQWAPSSPRLAVASRRTSYTVTLWPASSRQRAIGFPIVPVPMYPTSIYCSESLLLALSSLSAECLCENPTGDESPMCRSSLAVSALSLRSWVLDVMVNG